MNKGIKDQGKKRDKTLEIIALVIAVLCLTLGFLAFSSQLKVQSELTVHPEKLNFRVVFSTSNKNEKIEPITPKLEPIASGVTAQSAKIINKGNPVLTNLKVNFTKPGQRARYTFYVYNAGEYTAYLNNIIYSNVAGLNLEKVCLVKDGSATETIKKICDSIEISIKIGDIHTNKSMYNLNNRYLRARTAQKVEVTIEYLNEGNVSDDDFEVIFGDIYLQYSMFPLNNSDNKSELS